MAFLSFLKRKNDLDDESAVDASSHSPFESSGWSDGGPCRAENEDRFIIADQHGVWCVADGMGGHSDGAIAAQMVTDAVAEAAASRRPEAIEEALKGVSEALFVRSKTNAISGATVAVLKITGENCYCWWAGDCRIYRLRDNKLVQLTNDHSEINRLIAAGAISKDEAATHPMRHVVTRAVGAAETLEIEVVMESVRQGDAFLLCTDGITEGTSPEAAVEVLLDNHSDQARALVESAIKNGSTDNATAIVVRVA